MELFRIVLVGLLGLLGKSFVLDILEIGRVEIPRPIPAEYRVALKGNSSQLKKAKAIAVISELMLPAEMEFWFKYKLHFNETKGPQILFNFTIRSREQIDKEKGQRDEKIVAENMLLTLDYLITTHQDIEILNITTFQYHYLKEATYDNPTDSSEKEQLVLFLNGFSHMNLTENITYNFISNHEEGSMYTIHYSCGDSMGNDWGNNFILWTAVRLPKRLCRKEASASSLNCPRTVDQKFNLKKQNSFPIGNQYNYFYGLKGISQNTAHFRMDSDHAEIKAECRQMLEREDPIYSLNIIPIYRENVGIHDGRLNEVQEGLSSGYIILIIVGILMLGGLASYYLVRRSSLEFGRKILEQFQKSRKQAYELNEEKEEGQEAGTRHTSDDIPQQSSSLGI